MEVRDGTAQALAHHRSAVIAGGGTGDALRAALFRRCGRGAGSTCCDRARRRGPCPGPACRPRAGRRAARRRGGGGPHRGRGPARHIVSRRHHPARGVALPAALVVVAVAGAVSAAVATLAQTELVLARNRETAARALAAADACAASVTAGLPAGWEFDGPIAGDDGVAGTADDGLRPAPSGCSARLLTAPGVVEPPRALLDVEAVAGAGRRMIEGVLARNALPGAPALIWLAGSGSLHDPIGTLTLDASDA